MEITDTDRAYAAGLIDGEGCIAIAYPKSSSVSAKRYHRLDVVVAQKDPRPIVWLQTRWPGTIARKRSKPSMTYWRLSGALAERFLSDVREFLVLKREQAEVGLAFRATVRKRTSGHKRSGAGPLAGWESLDPVTKDLEVQRESMRLKLQVLKRQVS